MGAGSLFGYSVRFQYGKMTFEDVPFAAHATSPAAMLKPQMSVLDNGLVDMAPEDMESVAETAETRPIDLTVCNVYPWLLKGGKVPRNEICNISDLYIIGSGSTGVVRLAKWRYKHIHLLAAIKTVRKDYLLRFNDEKHIQHEKKALMAFRKSPFIIRLFNTFQDDEAVHFLLEYTPGGGLLHLLRQRQKFTSEEAKFYGAEIFLAIEHIHLMGFVYRDLCPDNVMISESGHIKLVDFGTAAPVDEHGLCRTFIGNRLYMSPERLNREEGYGVMVDWWSFGCLMYEFVCGVTPFSKLATDSPNDIYNRILKQNIIFPDHIPRSLVELISKLLILEKSSRLFDPFKIRDASFFIFPGYRWQDFEVRKIIPPLVPKVKPGGNPFYSDGNMQEHLPRSKYVFGVPIIKNYIDGF